MSGRFVYWIAAILALTAVYACWCRTPLIYDGSYQLAFTLKDQAPYAYLTRFHTLLLWRPVVWLSHYTSNLTALTFAYGLPFLLAPVVGLLGSWWVVRKDAPWLVLWAAFGIMAGPLPGQVFVINDSIFQQHLFWPVFLGFVAPGRRSWPQRVLLGVLVVFQLSHQIGLVLFGGMAFCAVVLALLSGRNPQDRGRMWGRVVVAVLLVGLMGFKIWLTSSPDRRVFGVDHVGPVAVAGHEVMGRFRFGDYYDSYAAEEARWEVAKVRWIGGVKGPPILGLSFMYAAAVLAFGAARLSAGRRASGSAGRGVGYAAMVAAGVGATIWVRWASQEWAWAWALEYRRWVVPLTMPFYLLALLEAAADLLARRRPMETAGSFPVIVRNAGGEAVEPPVVQRASDGPPSGDEDATPCIPVRVPLAYLLAATFAAVLGLQSVEFSYLTRRLMAQVEQDSRLIVPRGDVSMSWTGTTPLAHWATPTYVALLQGKSPRKLLLDPEADGRWLFADPPHVPLAYFVVIPPQPGRGGWLDHRRFVEDVHERYQPPDKVPTKPEQGPWGSEPYLLKPKAGGGPRPEGGP